MIRASATPLMCARDRAIEIITSTDLCLFPSLSARHGMIAKDNSSEKNRAASQMLPREPRKRMKESSHVGSVRSFGVATERASRIRADFYGMSNSSRISRASFDSSSKKLLRVNSFLKVGVATIHRACSFSELRFFGI